ncbi:MAG TPA: lipocalin-like domain-containing protein [Xanthobacteraceae bacterium]
MEAAGVLDQIDTGKRTDVFGDNPRGYLIVTADGGIAPIRAANSRKAPSSLAATDAEAAALFKTMLAYVGRYEIDPKPTQGGLGMTIRFEVSLNPRLEGLDRKFIVRTEGDRLIIKTTPPVRNPTTGEMTTRNVILERALRVHQTISGKVGLETSLGPRALGFTQPRTSVDRYSRTISRRAAQPPTIPRRSIDCC